MAEIHCQIGNFSSVSRLENATCSAEPLALRHQLPVDTWEDLFFQKVELLVRLSLVEPEGV